MSDSLLDNCLLDKADHSVAKNYLDPRRNTEELPVEFGIVYMLLY